MPIEVGRASPTSAVAGAVCEQHKYGSARGVLRDECPYSTFLAGCQDHSTTIAVAAAMVVPIIVVKRACFILLNWIRQTELNPQRPPRPLPGSLQILSSPRHHARHQVLPEACRAQYRVTRRVGDPCSVLCVRCASASILLARPFPICITQR